MNILKRNNISITGNMESSQTIMFAHGFGCDQNMWRFITPSFEDTHTVITFDYVGFGKSDISAYNFEKYNSLEGYADDILEICQALSLSNITLVCHSVSAMIGTLAAIKKPKLFNSIVMVGPSPRYINTEDYYGGFSEEDINELLTSLEKNYLGWSSQMAPVIMANSERPELGEELEANFCRTDPKIAEHFAKVTFTSDNRQELAQLKTKTLVLQCRDDVIAPESVGKYVHEQLANSTFVLLEATGHCPNLSAPEETTKAIKEFINA